jgi:hypothetical protein
VALEAPRVSARAITRSAGSAEATQTTGGAPTPRITGTGGTGGPTRVIPAPVAARTTRATGSIGSTGAVARRANSARGPAPPPGIGEAARSVAGTARAGPGPPRPAGAAVRPAARPGGCGRTNRGL